MDVLLVGDLLPEALLPDIPPVKDAPLLEAEPGTSPENEIRFEATEEVPPEKETRRTADEGTRAEPPDEE